MKVALDATPLLGPRTGVGHYVAGLAEGLVELPGPEPEEVALVPFTWRGTGDLPRVAPAGPRVRHGRRRVPARLLQAAWARMAFPPVEWLAGRVDVFHATNFVAPPARRAAVVVTVHDLTYLRYPEMVTAASARYRDLVPRALRRGAIVCTPTAAVADEVAGAYRLPPERLVVTSLGVGPAWRAATPPDPAWLAGRGLPERYLLFVGNREPRKNLPTLLAAYRELLAGRVPGAGRVPEPGRVPGAGQASGGAPAAGAGRVPGGAAAGPAEDTPPLVLVGPPGWGEALDLAGLPPEAVRTPGYLPEGDLARVVAGAAALVYPSWYEGFGLPALEALACGTPVVAADLPALREVLGDQAQLVPAGDATALADALARVLDDPGGGGGGTVTGGPLGRGGYPSGEGVPDRGAPRVGVVAEQLLRPVPGGIGRYVRALAEHLPAEAAVDGGTVTFVVCRHPEERLAAAGLPAATTRRLAWPGRLATRTWVTLRRPRLPAGLLGGLDLVHATSAAVPPAAGLPLVATVHDLGFRHFPDAYPAAGRRYHERSARIVADEAARVLVPSEATARDLAELYRIDRGRVRIIPLGVEPPAQPDHQGAARLLANLGVRGPFLLAVGTLEPRKNLPRLLAAFGEVTDELPDHWLVVVGPVGWGPRLRPTWESVRVKLAGPVGDTTLHALYQQADGLAYPSLYEGFGLPVLEAMAHGVPVLTSDRSSLPEVTGDAALLVDPNDRGAIAKGLVRLVTDGALRARLAAAGPRRAAAFSWPATAAATWAAYREVLG